MPGKQAKILSDANVDALLAYAAGWLAGAGASAQSGLGGQQHDDFISRLPS